jgi:peroxiredoxin
MKHSGILATLLLIGSVAALGQSIQNFSLVNVIDDKPVSLNNYSSAAGVVVIFTGNDCPFDQYYLDRIKALAKDYTLRVPVLLINSHSGEKEASTAMKQYAQRCNITIPYLADKDQSVLNQFSARKSPEAFLLKNTAGKFSIVYKGALDDNPQTATEVQNTYLRTAIDNMLAGKKIEVNDVRPVGCSIRKN